MTEDDQLPMTTAHEPPPGASTTGTWNGLDYAVTSGWTVLRKEDKPLAEVFSTSYVATTTDAARPVTFVFNGGPGASSAYLHVGLVGPRRVDIPADGTMPVPPPRLVHNDESWLAFTDLVFIDPVGTGFSRLIDPPPGQGKDDAADPHEYFSTARDLQAMCEFIRRWLSDNSRWGAAVLIAGESYGGYRVGRLTRLLQETGVVLSGSILISPALEPAHLSTFFGWGDYNIVPWIDVLPTMAAAAAHHGRSRAFPPGTPVEEVQAAAEEFATGAYATFLARGSSMTTTEREQVIARYADLTGLDRAFVARAEGRVRVSQFARELLRDEQQVVGAYDASVKAPDPFPDREPYAGADPTLTAVGPVFGTAVNQLLRSEIGLRTDREYQLLSADVILAWKNDEASHYVQLTQGAVDDFRYGMSLNPHMKAFITHGRYDLVTPYYASDRMRNLMRLDPQVADRITVKHYDGGHMFYAWQPSREAFTAAIATFVADATQGV